MAEPRSNRAADPDRKRCACPDYFPSFLLHAWVELLCLSEEAGQHPNVARRCCPDERLHFLHGQAELLCLSEEAGQHPTVVLAVLSACSQLLLFAEYVGPAAAPE